MLFTRNVAPANRAVRSGRVLRARSERALAIFEEWKCVEESSFPLPCEVITVQVPSKLLANFRILIAQATCAAFARTKRTEREALEYTHGKPNGWSPTGYVGAWAGDAIPEEQAMGPLPA